MKKVLVILVTHSSYSDVCANFIELYKKNWSDCNYDFVISVVGDHVTFGKERVVYNGSTCTLPNAVYSIMEASDYDYCISFLGDAFINSRIHNEEINELMEEIYKYNISYCCLIPRTAFRFKYNKIGKNLRYISSNDIYNMSFVAFVASKDFVQQEFGNNITDLEFEMKYIMQNGDKDFFYTDRVILTKNIFHLEPGIDAGKWNRHAYKKIKRNNKDLVLAKRQKVSRFKMIIADIYMILQVVISKKQRKALKRIISKLFNVQFVTKF